MKKYIIGTIMVFLLFVVFTSANLIIGAEGEPNYVLQNLEGYATNETVIEDLHFSRDEGKVVFEFTIPLSDIPTTTTYGKEVLFPVTMYYDIYSTGNETDTLIYTTTGTAKVYYTMSNNQLSIADIQVYIPYSVEYFFTAITRGYDDILTALKTEFRQGFPTVPSGDNVLDYVRYIGRGLFHSVTSVAITFDFVVFPINIMRGIFI